MHFHAAHVSALMSACKRVQPGNIIQINSLDELVEPYYKCWTETFDER